MMSGNDDDFADDVDRVHTGLILGSVILYVYIYVYK